MPLMYLTGGINTCSPDYTIKGWGDDGSDIDVMRIVVREELKLPLMHKTISAILECVNSMVQR